MKGNQSSQAVAAKSASAAIKRREQLLQRVAGTYNVKLFISMQTIIYYLFLRRRARAKQTNCL